MRVSKAHLKCVTVAILVIATASVPWWYKKPIEKATYEELVSICGIGESRAMLVLKSGVDDVDDLYKVDGIGERTVYALKQKYR